MFCVTDGWMDGQKGHLLSVPSVPIIVKDYELTSRPTSESSSIELNLSCKLNQTWTRPEMGLYLTWALLQVPFHVLFEVYLKLTLQVYLQVYLQILNVILNVILNAEINETLLEVIQ